MIDFNIKFKGLQGFAFVQIMFEKCTANFYFTNPDVDIKATFADLLSLLACNVSPCSRIFVQFKMKLCVYETSTIWRIRRIFAKLVAVFES